MASGPTQRETPSAEPLLDAAELRRFGSWLLAGGLMGILVALLLAFVWTPRWEATVQIRPGQIANGNSAQIFLESPARLAERLNARAFIESLKTRLGLPPGDADPRSRLLDGSFKATVLERAALVVLRVEGFSVDEARRFAEAALKQLSDAHAPMYQPTVERLNTQLREIDDDLKRIEGERERLLSTAGENRPAARAADRFSESVLIGNLINIRDSELRGLRDRASSIREVLSPERTFPTGPIDRVTVPDRPSFPRKSIHAVGGAVLGTLVGAVLALLVRRRS